MHGQEDANAILDALLGDADPRVLVYVDPDIDGVVAGCLLMAFLDEHNVKYSTYINPNRAHGFFLTDDELESLFAGDNSSLGKGSISNTQGGTKSKDFSNCYIVHGDFTTTEEQLHHLCLLGIRVLSTDHHDLPQGQKYIRAVSPEGDILGCVINNQYEFEPETGRYLSGAGVVLKVLRGYAGRSWGGAAAERLVGWTLLSDVCDISGAQARWWLKKLYSWDYAATTYQTSTEKVLADTLKHVYMEVDRLTPSYSFGKPMLTRTKVDFRLSPAINALFRFGRENEAVALFRGGEYPRTGIRDGRYELTFQKAQRKISKVLEEKAVTTPYGKDFLVIDYVDNPSDYVDVGIAGTDPSNFVGLVCNRFLDRYPCVLGISRNSDLVITRASFRGKYAVPYLEYLHKTELLDGAGHSSAFGVPSIVGTKGDDVDFRRIGALMSLLNRKYRETHTEEETGRVFEVGDLQLFSVTNPLQDIAEYNEFASSAMRVLLRYTGRSVVVEDASPGRTVFNVEGERVLSFNTTITEDNFSEHVIDVSKSNSGYDLILR